MESARSPVAIAAVASFVQQSLEKLGIDFSNRKVSKLVHSHSCCENRMIVIITNIGIIMTLTVPSSVCLNRET
jgi:hypothetical protein